MIMTEKEAHKICRSLIRTCACIVYQQEDRNDTNKSLLKETCSQESKIYFQGYIDPGLVFT